MRTTLREELGPGTSMRKVAGAVVAMFARADREQPEPEIARALKREEKIKKKQRVRRVEIDPKQALTAIFGEPEGEAFDDEGADRIAVQFFTADDEPPFVYFVTVGLANRDPVGGSDRYELGLELGGSYAPSELHEIGRRFGSAARRLANAGVALEQIVTIHELEPLFPGRRQAYVADLMFREPTLLAMGPNGSTARLLFLRPVFEEELRWIRTMSQARVGVAFLEAGVELNDPERDRLPGRRAPSYRVTRRRVQR